MISMAVYMHPDDPEGEYLRGLLRRSGLAIVASIVNPPVADKFEDLCIAEGRRDDIVRLGPTGPFQVNLLSYPELAASELGRLVRRVLPDSKGPFTDEVDDVQEFLTALIHMIRVTHHREPTLVDLHGLTDDPERIGLLLQSPDDELEPDRRWHSARWKTFPAVYRDDLGRRIANACAIPSQPDFARAFSAFPGETNSPGFRSWLREGKILFWPSHLAPTADAFLLGQLIDQQCFHAALLERQETARSP
jgi:hypothetical protein